MKPVSHKSPKLLDQLHLKLRANHHAYRTEQSYARWVERAGGTDRASHDRAILPILRAVGALRGRIIGAWTWVGCSAIHPEEREEHEGLPPGARPTWGGPITQRALRDTGLGNATPLA